MHVHGAQVIQNDSLLVGFLLSKGGIASSQYSGDFACCAHMFVKYCAFAAPMPTKVRVNRGLASCGFLIQTKKRKIKFT